MADPDLNQCSHPHIPKDGQTGRTAMRKLMVCIPRDIRRILEFATGGMYGFGSPPRSALRCYSRSSAAAREQLSLQSRRRRPALQPELASQQKSVPALLREVSDHHRAGVQHVSTAPMPMPPSGAALGAGCGTVTERERTRLKELTTQFAGHAPTAHTANRADLAQGALRRSRMGVRFQIRRPS